MTCTEWHPAATADDLAGRTERHFRTLRAHAVGESRNGMPKEGTR